MKRVDRERLEAKSVACDRHAPYVPLAERIATEVAAFNLAQQAIENPAGVMELIVADLTESEIRKLVRRKFDELPAAAKVEILASTYPDDMILRGRLMEERERLRARGQLASNVAELKHDAELYGKVSLGRIAQGALVDLYLYDEDDYEEADGSCKRLTNEYDYYRLIKATSLGDGRLHLLEDITGDETEYTPVFEDHEILELGTALYDRRHDQSTFDRDIYAGTHVYADMGETYDLLMVGPQDDGSILVAGQLLVNNEVIF